MQGFGPVLRFCTLESRKRHVSEQQPDVFRVEVTHAGLTSTTTSHCCCAAWRECRRVLVGSRLPAGSCRHLVQPIISAIGHRRLVGVQRARLQRPAAESPGALGGPFTWLGRHRKCVFFGRVCVRDRCRHGNASQVPSVFYFIAAVRLTVTFICAFCSSCNPVTPVGTMGFRCRPRL